jgi:hypothetical protein
MLMVAALVALVVPTAAQASPGDNALQPSPVYFGKVQAGTHPTVTVTVTNDTARNQYLRAIGLSGAGGGKFTYTWRRATCRVGMNLLAGESCTLVVRVAASLPEWYESHMLVNYGPRIHARPMRGNWNGAVYAHVVAS